MKLYGTLLLLLSAPLSGSVCGEGTQQPLGHDRVTYALRAGPDGCLGLVLASPCASLLP
jgi:hypothetical protein